jgi:hypothetical protein
MVQKTFSHTVQWYLYSVACCAAMAYIPAYSYRLTMSPDGQILGFFETGFTQLCLLTILNHLNVWIGTRNWSWSLTLLYFLSILMLMPVAIAINNVLKTA